MPIDFKQGDSIEVLESENTLRKRIAGCVGVVNDVRGGVFTVLLTEPDGTSYVGTTDLTASELRLQDGVMV